jgi:putative membrane protein
VRHTLCFLGASIACAAAVGVGSTGATSARDASPLSAQDVNYLQTSISGDRFEIIGGKMAVQKGGTPQIKALGQRLVKDHSKSLQESLTEARKNGVKAPLAPTPSMAWELQTVGAMSGSEFDRAYTSLEVKDHQQDIEETIFEIQHGSDPSLMQSAKNELPVLRTHLTLSMKASRTA